MSSTVAALAEAVATVAALWPGEHVEGTDAGRLVQLNAALGRVDRLRAALHAQVASEISRQSRPELGPEGLAKTQGFRNPTALIAATTGTSDGEAARLVQVGEATAPRVLFTGEHAPARHPHVGAALAAGRIGSAAAAAIITMLDRVALRADPSALDRAEQTLASQAAGLSLDQLGKLIVRAEAWLDPDGLEPREQQHHADRFFRMAEHRDGSVVFTGKMAADEAAPVLTVLRGMVAAELGGHGSAAASAVEPDERRTIPQMQADALVRVCRHLLGCEQRDVPLEGATVVVRLTLADLQAGTGCATVDGLDTPVSVSAARRMAAGGRIIPVVLGGRSEILDWGRRKRLFTNAQRWALVERDGGCVGCGAPPGWCQAHHLRWWSAHDGETDLGNGVLLCGSCHHRIHDNGYEIRIDAGGDSRGGRGGGGTAARVWTIPPAHVDSSRTPRLGGRARYDFVPA
jgi:hypothetical protein